MVLLFIAIVIVLFTVLSFYVDVMCFKITFLISSLLVFEHHR
jgi:hypothetical protein